MKRLAFIIATTMIVLSAAYHGSGVGAQDGTEPTIQALKTRVVELKATSEARGEQINEQRTEIAELRSGPGSDATTVPTPESQPPASNAEWTEAAPGIDYYAYGAPSEFGGVYLFAEVRNTTGVAIAAPFVYVTLLDTDGNIVGASSLIALHPNVEDQSTTPYQVFMNDVAAGSWESEQVEIGLQSVGPTICTLELRDVEEVEKGRDRLRVNGSAYNGSETVADGVIVYAAWYTEDGVFAGSSSNGSDLGAIPPGKSSRFTVFGLIPAGFALPGVGDSYSYRLLAINVSAGTVYC